MARITVKHRYGESFDIQIRGYRLVSDEPVAIGGEDEGPTPTELMVAGLAACAAEEGVKHLSNEGLPFEPFAVEADFSWDIENGRIDHVQLTISTPPGLTDSDHRFLEAAMVACPARKMLTEPPTLKYAFSEPAAVTAEGR
ncbi:MAG TPA: OsmC family protein [Candidatus Dormibacteraeota bacterium]|nr:OsmC family protein [Candidatus Dormibacteraeota bacterium]